jgi:hypothetical protein
MELPLKEKVKWNGNVGAVEVLPMAMAMAMGELGNGNGNRIRS